MKLREGQDSMVSICCRRSFESEKRKNTEVDLRRK
jgi:hypothetical protein